MSWRCATRASGRRPPNAAQAALARYFSPNLARSLADDAAALAGRRREIATLFTDIAGFTALVETLDPDVLTVLLGEYLTGMTEIVFAREGTVAKIIGDAIHVLFGAPAEQPDAAARAIACALALDEWAEAFCLRWRENNVAVGAHAHRRPRRLGGGRQFRRRPAVRLHGLWRHHQRRRRGWRRPTRRSARAFASAPPPSTRAGEFAGRPIGDLVLRGRAEPMRAYEPLPEARRADATAYARAFEKLEAKDPTAIAAFAALVGERPDDPLAQYHLRRLLNGASGVRLDLT